MYFKHINEKGINSILQSEVNEPSFYISNYYKLEAERDNFIQPAISNISTCNYLRELIWKLNYFNLMIN